MVWTSRKMLSNIFALFGSCSILDELVVNRVQTLVGLGQEFAKKIIHAFWPSKRRGDVVAPFTAGPVSTQSVNIG